MKKLNFVLGVLLIFFCLDSEAQIANRALKFGEDGKVKGANVYAIDKSDTYSVQFWMKPDKLMKDARLLSIGKYFNIVLDNADNTPVIKFESDREGFSVNAPMLKEGEWTQVTLICENGNADVLLDGKEAGGGKLKPLKVTGDSSVVLGGGYDGMIDEVRIWDAALDGEMKRFDYFTNNTLNRWCPAWDNLVVYYKDSFRNCNLSGNVEVVEVDNEKMPYLRNAAYTNNDRFFDCLIPRDQYLLHNELIILGTDVYAEDGRIEPKTPNNHALAMHGVEYMPEYKGRHGVVRLKGEKQGIEIPAATIKDDGYFTFETWVCPEEYTPGASLLNKKDGDSIFRLGFEGNPENPEIMVVLGGKVYKGGDLPLKAGEWGHVAVSVDGKMPSLYINGRKYDVEEVARQENPRAIAEGIGIGEGLKAKIDETVIWNKVWDEDDIRSHMSYIPLPAIDRHVNKEDMRKVGAYYRFDDPEDLAHSSHSQDGWLDIMKGAYDGAEGVRYYISVQGTYRVREQFGDWREILGSPDKRKRFVEDLAMLSRNYDGVELDLEWIENPGEWEDFGLLCQEIREGLPEEKEFRVSLHNNYTAFPPDKMKYVDGFTFQQYGPNPKNFSYENFEMNVGRFEKKFDKDKIMTSYATTTSRGENGTPPSGVRFGMLDAYEPGDQDIDRYGNGYDTWSFTGPMQVYKRGKFTREQGLEGIFYWDMGNDHWEGNEIEPVMPRFNLAKYCSFAINANNDALMEVSPSP